MSQDMIRIHVVTVRLTACNSTVNVIGHMFAYVTRHGKRKWIPTCRRKRHYGRRRDIARLARQPTVLKDVGIPLTVDLPIGTIDVLVYTVWGLGAGWWGRYNRPTINLSVWKSSLCPKSTSKSVRVLVLLGRNKLVNWAQLSVDSNLTNKSIP